jgi:hypothetical protein
MKAASWEGFSTNTAEAPAGRLATPDNTPPSANESESSSAFQPVRSTAVEPSLVSSNQSPPTALSFPVGSTSVTFTSGRGGTITFAVAPGEPIY